MSTLDFDKIAGDLQAGNRRFVVESDSDGVIVHFNGPSSTDPADFNLSSLPLGEAFPRLSFITMRPLLLKTLYATASVRVVIDSSGSHHSSQLILASTVQGQIEVAGQRVSVESEPGCEAPIFHRDGGILHGLNERVHVTVRPKTADVIPKVSGTMGRITLEAATVECLDLDLVHTLSLRGGASKIICGTDLALTNLAGDGSLLHIARSDSMHPMSAFSVRVSGRVSNISVTGPCDLIARQIVSATFYEPIRLTVLDRASMVHLSGALLRLGDRSAVIAGLRGRGRLGDLHGGSVLGDSVAGFEVESVVPENNGTPLRDAQLGNVRFAPGLAGLQDLSYAADLRRLEPHRHNLLGENLRFGRYVPFLFAGEFRRSERLILSYDADFMRRLAELSREKGASGSTVTKVGWCSERLRHEITTGFWERSALFFYRLLGYGERPGPPLATWLVASLMFTALLNAQHGLQFDAPGASNFLDAWVTDAVSPIGSILRTGSTASDSAWVYLVRAIVAVPLIVSVLALRKYTRAT